MLNPTRPESSRRRTKARHAANDPSTMPDIYGLQLIGTCMEPLIKDGALCAFTKVEPPRAGDIVVIWWRPETVPEGELQASVKRLVMGPPPKLTFPHNDQPESTAIPTITVEMLNPKRYMRTLCSEVLALHKYVGEIPSERASWRRLGGGQ